MRIFFFILVSILAYTLPWWAGLVVLCFYAFRYTAYELIILGVFLDAQYGVVLPWLPVPVLYTLALTAMLLVVESLKPMMSFYEEQS